MAIARRGSIIVVGNCSRHPTACYSLWNVGSCNKHTPLSETLATFNVTQILLQTDQGRSVVNRVPLNAKKETKSSNGAAFKPNPIQPGLGNWLHSFSLTHREQEIAILVMKGFSNRQIAETLFICEQTVKDHLRNIFQRVCVHRRSELSGKFLTFMTDSQFSRRLTLNKPTV